MKAGRTLGSSESTGGASGAEIARERWTTGIGAHMIGVFLWVAYFDQLARRTLLVGGLGWSLAGLLAAGLACFVLFYLVPATWGVRARRPLVELASSTFGSGGARWVPGALMALAQVAWFAVSIWYGVTFTLGGLADLGLIAPRDLAPLESRGVRVESPLFLVVSLVWSAAVALTATYLSGVIAALNRIFPIFPALMLGLAMMVTLGGLAGFRAPGPGGVDAAWSAGWLTFGAMIQLTCSYFATAGAASADWGAASRDARDVRVGGLVGVVVAPVVLGTIALLTVAGSLGGDELDRSFGPPSALAEPGLPPASAPPVDPTYRAAIRRGIGGRSGGVVLVVLGLAALAPGCFAALTVGRRLVELSSVGSRVTWTLAGAGAAWPLVATGAASHVEPIFGGVGAAFAAVLGALAADFARQRGRWPGPRVGVNLAGMIGWALGFAAGLVPVVLAEIRGDPPRPWVLVAFAVAFLAHALVAAIAGEPAVVDAGALPSGP